MYSNIRPFIDLAIRILIKNRTVYNDVLPVHSLQHRLVFHDVLVGCEKSVELTRLDFVFINRFTHTRYSAIHNLQDAVANYL